MTVQVLDKLIGALHSTACRRAEQAHNGNLMAAPSGEYSTQRVTAADLSSGQIRIPLRRSSRAMTLFPRLKATVQVLLRGRSVPASWNPRTGLDRQRSGVLRVGSVLHELVRENEVLTVSAGENGIISL